MTQGRLPIESAEPVVVFAVARLALVVAALVAMLVVGFPYEGRTVAVLGLLALPWSLACLALALRTPESALNPLVAAGEVVVLIVLQDVVPETLGAVRSSALFVIAAHAHFQGERRGLAIALLGSVSLVVASAIRGDAPVGGDVLAFYETMFILAAAAIGVVVGRLRTAESTSRLRARSLSRRTIQAESEVRRRLAEAIHDGPVQELIGLDMMVAAARQAAAQGRAQEAASLLDEAHEVAERNIRVLRDEIVDLGPYAFEELSFDTAIANCAPTWKRRFGFDLEADIDPLELPSPMAGDLFRVAQEAVINAGRHARANTVAISLHAVNSSVVLRVSDDGRGFPNGHPLGASQPGHLGLASMRERAELLEGELQIDTSERGTTILLRAPLPPSDRPGIGGGPGA